MLTIARPDVLKATYEAVSARIQAGGIPTTLLYAGHTVFRSVPVAYLPKPTPGGHVSKRLTTNVLEPRDETVERQNRFSGPSYNASVSGAGGLYCVLQQQALVNEIVFYARRAGLPRQLQKGQTLSLAALADKAVVKIVLLRQMLVADLSPHNPGAANFFQAIQQTPDYMQLLGRTQYSSAVSMWNRMVDTDDCSVARGIGLAIANSRLDGLCIQTVRRSGRSPDENGDNLVLFGRNGTFIPGLSVTQSSYFGSSAGIEIFPVQYP